MTKSSDLGSNIINERKGQNQSPMGPTEICNDLRLSESGFSRVRGLHCILRKGSFS